MSLREITEGIPPEDWERLQSKQNVRQWIGLKCKLLTPLHGGGVKARESDKDLPIRVTGIRGELRFWWRILAQYKYRLPEIPEAEFALWGGIGQKEHASLVFFKIKMHDNNVLRLVSPKEYISNENSPLNYALFTTRKTTTLPEMKLGKEGLEWTLEYAFDKKISNEQRDQVLETLRWWATLGGIGGRTRRGCGVVQVQGLQPVSVQEMRDLGCEILYPDPDSLKNQDKIHDKIQLVWSDAISFWKTIRKEHKHSFQNLLGKKDEHSRHLVTVLSRPVLDGTKWCGMVIVLPNSSEPVKKIAKQVLQQNNNSEQ